MRAALLTSFVAALLSFGSAGLVAAADTASAKPRQLSIANKPWTGDFDRMVARRMIRVLVPYSRTLYYTDKGRERGLTAELMRDFEQYVNRKYKTGKRPITFYLIPTTRDRLLPELASGLGDIAAGNLTATDERLRLVDFVTQTDRPAVKELVVTHTRGSSVASPDDLSGRTVHVREASSYYDSLVALNARFEREGRPPIRLHLVPDALEDEDMMEMANAGLIDVLIVDDWKAKLWASILPNLRIDDGVFVRESGRIGWAIRKDSPQLAAAIRDFDATIARKQGTYAYRLRQSMQRIRQLQDPTTTGDWKRFEQLLALFHRYGERYGFDPLMLAAQGYQESQLRQEARSHVGAIGVMQLMPATGAEMKVGDINVTEPNIHAGAKYMDILMTKYFPDAHFSEGNRPLFAFASYNAGAGNIARMRKEAVKRGLDPDKWFNNVELVVAEKIGIETTTYVRNIYKYYVTYKLTLDAQEQRRKALEDARKASVK
ncbi:MAG TPA: transporter substrate-binding domain-containing protein [Casimicrobiaceae bacterium]|nr:transporter substrate-binding domain-containing protein [Casimicrobiaceae bacterium]